jgi:hypothetical protein
MTIRGMIVALEAMTLVVAVAIFVLAVAAGSEALSLTAAFIAACLVGGAWVLDRTRRDLG